VKKALDKKREEKQQCKKKAISQEKTEKNSPKSRNNQIYKQPKNYTEYWIRTPHKT